MTEPAAVRHEIEPVFDARSRVLLLGTMPSPASRTAGFFYGHPQNRFWRVLAALFDEPAPRDTPEKCDLLLRHGIALWDVLAECTISGASDASIRDARPNDLRRIFGAADIQAVFTTGSKAGELYRKLIEPTLGMPCTVLPSTSAANAKMKLGDLVAAYGEALLPFMGKSKRHVLDVPQVAKLEAAIAEGDTSLSTLMERAGRALAKVALEEARASLELSAVKQAQAQIPHGTCECEPDKVPLAADAETISPADSKNGSAPRPVTSPAGRLRIAILCGSGNNGGDGWVAARELAEAGCDVAVISKYAASKLTAEPARKQAIATEHAAGSVIEHKSEKPEVESACTQEGHNTGRTVKAPTSGTAPTLTIHVAPATETVAELLAQADVIVDAILGTGFSGDAVRAPYDEWIRLANAQRKRGARIVAADVPSGLSAHSGKAAEPCLKAHKTVTMITSKPGLETPYAFAFCGDVQVAPIAYIEPILEAWQEETRAETAKGEPAKPQNSQVNAASVGKPAGPNPQTGTAGSAAQAAQPNGSTLGGTNKAARPTTSKASRPTLIKHDAFRRAETEDDDGYDPYSDRPPTPEPLFEADPWA